jgi:hypothetical protein
MILIVFLGRHGTKPPTRQNIPKQRDSSALKMGMTEQNCPWHGIGWYDIYKYVIYIYTRPIGSMYAIYGNIYHQYTPNVSIYTIHGSYGKLSGMGVNWIQLRVKYMVK